MKTSVYPDGQVDQVLPPALFLPVEKFK